MPPILAAIVVIGGAGVACALLLVIAARYLHVFEDPRVEAITNLLPGANCGGCGYAGCADYARAIVEKGAPVNLCRPCAAAALLEIARLMGVEAKPAEKMVAIVRCNGDAVRSRRAALYHGVADCVAADFTSGGGKICREGCLGYGNCARVCPVGAIVFTESLLAVVSPERCIGCGLCVKACPRHLIRLVPASHTIHLLCSNRERGLVTRKACSVGCIACQKCIKHVNGQGIHMEGYLAVVDYTVPLPESLLDVCPQHCFVRRGLPAPPPQPAAPSAP
jgi:Na+-translocating ferredoxin:NAD+ oxidoreductase RNF subunit RnfB